MRLYTQERYHAKNANDPDDNDAVAARAAGVFDYFPKPLTQEKLLQITSIALQAYQ